MKRKFIVIFFVLLILMATFNATRVEPHDLQSESSQLAYIKILANILLLVAVGILYFQNSSKNPSKK